MPIFPSSAWMQDFCAELAAHPEAGAVARTLDGVYRFVIEPAGPMPERHTYDVTIRPDGAGAADVSCADGAGDTPPVLTLTAGYDRWRQLIRGELDVTMAIMLRRLRVGGDLSRLTSELSNPRPLLDALGAVDTQWP